jgi:hypothetical protein
MAGLALNQCHVVLFLDIKTQVEHIRYALPGHVGKIDDRLNNWRACCTNRIEFGVLDVALATKSRDTGSPWSRHASDRRRGRSG